MGTSPEMLAVRAVNQYRRRDIIGYLGLRYYLDNVCAVRDRWSNEIATLLAQYEDNPVYHTTWHFKERCSETNQIKYRRMCLPSPNEIMAETALIAACGNAGSIFQTHPSVYSYRISTGSETGGVFQPYYKGFQQRHRDIAEAAKGHDGGVVVYTDLRQFYPSISSKIASQAWIANGGKSQLPRCYVDLGIKLIETHTSHCDDNEKGLLTGPMFSHLIANLVLRSLDEKMGEIIPGGYFRYVDDIALVGAPKQVADAESIITDHLGAMALGVNEDKRFEVTTSQWLMGEADFSNELDRVSWKTVVGRLKQLLIAKPELTEDITRQFNDNGFRIKPLDYTNAVRDQEYLSRMKSLVTNGWIRRRIQHATPSRLLNDAKTIRTRYTQEFWDWIDKRADENKYEQKRRIHALRRYSSLLVYLADPDDIPSIVEALYVMPEMELYAVIFEAIHSGDVSKLVNYGVNATHSAASPLLACFDHVRCDSTMDSEAVRQAVAILQAHGLIVKSSDRLLVDDEMSYFCRGEVINGASNKKVRSYIGDISSLHGFDRECRHKDILFSAFDTNEDLVTEISDIMNTSGS